MCKHYDCLYYAPVSESCDYMLITGKRRPCLPTDDCICHCTREEDVERLNKFCSVRTVDLPGVRRMEAVYTPALDAHSLSALAHVTRREALGWIRKVHPENAVLQNSKGRFYARGGEQYE